jgi:hypothetical protein
MTALTAAHTAMAQVIVAGVFGAVDADLVAWVGTD